MGNVCVVTDNSSLAVVKKNLHILIFSKYKYLHVKIGSLANVKSCVTIGPVH